MDTLHFESQARKAGYVHIAGVDEAGRGPLAGPVTAAALVLPADLQAFEETPSFRLIRDSKTLSARQRDRAYGWLTTVLQPVYAVAVIEPEVIDEINILQATHRAFREALTGLEPAADFGLIDGRPIPDLPCPSESIVQGDRKSLSIGAASIIAKVTRDRLMLDYAKQYPQYGFDRHMGYGTKAHLQALREHGPCPIHRKSFRPVREWNSAAHPVSP